MLEVFSTYRRHTLRYRVPVERPEDGFTSLDSAWSSEWVEVPAYFWFSTTMVESAIGKTKVQGMQGYAVVDDPVPFGSIVEVYAEEGLVASGYATKDYRQQNRATDRYIKVPVAEWVYAGFVPDLVTVEAPALVAGDVYNQQATVYTPVPELTGVVAYRQVYELTLESSRGVQLCGFLFPGDVSVVLASRIVASSNTYMVRSGQEFPGFTYLGGELVGKGNYLEG